MAGSFEVGGDFKNRVSNALKNNVREYKALRAGAQSSYALNVNVTEIEFLNPLKDFFAGDSTHIRATSTLVNPQNGSLIHTFGHFYVDEEGVSWDGVSENPRKSPQYKNKIEGNLAKGLAASVMKSVFPNTVLSPEAAGRVKSDAVLLPAP